MARIKIMDIPIEENVKEVEMRKLLGGYRRNPWRYTPIIWTAFAKYRELYDRSQGVYCWNRSRVKAKRLYTDKVCEAPA